MVFDSAHGLSELPWKKAIGETMARPNNQAWFDITVTESLPSPFLWQPRVLYGKNHDKKGLERHRRAFTLTNFLTRCHVYPCRDYLQKAVSAPLKFWPPVPHHVWSRYVQTENWECRALKSSARYQKVGVPCRFFSACKWGLIFQDTGTHCWCILNII